MEPAQRPRLGLELSVTTLLYVVLAVPLSTVVVLFVPAYALILLLNGGSIQPAGMEFWSVVAFFVGALAIVGISVRVWRRGKRGEPGAIHPGVTRFIPALIGLGVLGALGLGVLGWQAHVERLDFEAKLFCYDVPTTPQFSRPECVAAARACLAARPAYAPGGYDARMRALGLCMEKARH